VEVDEVLLPDVLVEILRAISEPGRVEDVVGGGNAEKPLSFVPVPVAAATNPVRSPRRERY
jgi:hypothetical protein